jgi:hypothetical protein
MGSLGKGWKVVRSAMVVVKFVEVSFFNGLEIGGGCVEGID